MHTSLADEMALHCSTNTVLVNRSPHLVQDTGIHVACLALCAVKVERKLGDVYRDPIPLHSCLTSLLHRHAVTSCQLLHSDGAVRSLRCWERQLGQISAMLEAYPSKRAPNPLNPNGFPL